MVKSKKTSARRPKTQVKRKSARIPLYWLVSGVLVVVILGGSIFASFLIYSKDPADSSSDRSYAKYRELYEEVVNYNYGHGGNDKLEAKVVTAANGGSNNPGGYFFYLLAASEYYYRTQQYGTSLEYTRLAEPYAPTDAEWLMLQEQYLKTYKKTGDTENIAKYQAIYDEYTKAPADCASEDENEK